MRHLHLTPIRAAIGVLSALIAPAALGLDPYESGEQFSLGLAKLIACVLILILLRTNTSGRSHP